ncbi:leucyl aminopeptidase, partial [Escherichia coli]
IEYKGNAPEVARPIVLVGKGLTFDPSGTSIKPTEGMDAIRSDMCGPAALYAVMRLVTELQLTLNIFGLLVGPETTPAGAPYSP